MPKPDSTAWYDGTRVPEIFQQGFVTGIKVISIDIQKLLVRGHAYYTATDTGVKCVIYFYF